ncbi:MAG: putative penicillin-binding protein PbpX [Syntrophomonadaceae bacterium]|nr:putative penicillin-binding protein PbpX [Bacillota bacterium]
MKKIIVVLTALALISFTVGCNGQNINAVITFDCLNSFIKQEMESKRIPGLSASIIKDDEIIWVNSFGYANIANQIKVSGETIFMVASVSKPVVATAIMQLYEKGRLDLDDNVNDYLPFQVINPNYPNEHITFRMLLAHTSSINDNDYEVYSWGKDSPVALGDFLRDYFVPGGEHYSEVENFHKSKPGTYYDYSNVGFALLGYLVENISGKPFDEYCKENIFIPLGMTSTAWKLKDIDISRKAVPYNTDWQPYQHYTFADYPAGQLMTTINDISNFLLAYIRGGAINGRQLLLSSTIELMKDRQFTEVQNVFGLGWYYDSRIGQELFGHIGIEMGIRTVMFFNPETNIGGIILSNGEDVDLFPILEQMFKATK